MVAAGPAVRGLYLLPIQLIPPLPMKGKAAMRNSNIVTERPVPLIPTDDHDPIEPWSQALVQAFHRKGEHKDQLKVTVGGCLDTAVATVSTNYQSTPNTISLVAGERGIDRLHAMPEIQTICQCYEAVHEMRHGDLWTLVERAAAALTTAPLPRRAFTLYYIPPNLLMDCQKIAKPLATTKNVILARAIAIGVLDARLGPEGRALIRDFCSWQEGLAEVVTTAKHVVQLATQEGPYREPAATYLKLRQQRPR
jgi:hypothetical protein